MKNVLSLLLILVLFSCKKEPMYGPFKLKNGQEVDLLVDHRYGSDTDLTYKLPEKASAESPLIGFNDREPGYTYTVRARFRYDENPPQDATSSVFEFIKVVDKVQYKGSEPFNIQLIWSLIPGGPFIRMNKQGSDYYYISDKLQLTYANTSVQSQLEEVWQNALEMRTNPQANRLPKWKAVKATVIHDSSKFGKAYLVQSIQFIQ